MFFVAWEMKGKFPQILDDPEQGPAARELYENAVDACAGSAGETARRAMWRPRSERRLQTSTPRWVQRETRQEMAREGRSASPRTAAAQHTPSEKCGGSIRSERTQRQPSR